MNKINQILAILLFVPAMMLAQTPASNYVMTETVLSADGSNRVRSVQYHDGLGRPSVLASGGMNTSGKYVYTMTEYDLQGRESKIWLASAGGSSPVLISNSQMASYASSSYNQDQYPFSTVDYDAVGRGVFRSTPGQSWHDSGTHQGVETKYLANEANSVKQYTVDTSGNLVTSSVGYYPAGTLTSEKVKDEDGHTTQVYKDMLGNVVLEHRSGNNDTYYVYDKGLLTSDNRRQLRVIFYDAKADISGYKYTYDGLNRIQTATSMIYSGSQPAITNHYSVEVGYNENGSINSLKRYGQQNNQSFGKVDELSFSYVNGNQLSRVTDAATAVLSSTAMDFHDNTIDTHGASEYGYDGCGSLTYDANKGLVKIEYDIWGYPRRVYFSNYGMAEYVYSADGVRLKTRHVTAVPKSTPAPLNVAFKLSANEITSVDSTEYYGAYIYENGAFRQFNFGSGYIVPSGSAYAYKYYLKDHLGSNRVVVSSAGTIEQTTHYYPYGATLSSSTGQNVQPYKYNGKELDRMHRLDLYDYGARQYDPVIGQFTQIDPLCEKYYHISPYAYCNNNPIKYIDPDGRSTQVKKLEDGTYQVIGGDINDKDRNIYVYTQDENGNYTKRGYSIGVTATMTSFYNSDEKNPNQRWGGIINPKDNNGVCFLNEIMGEESPNLLEYMYYARNGKKYDFKVTNGTDSEINGIDPQRGMPISTMSNGTITYASARDIGNMAAGYIAAKNGITWKAARKAFDYYQGCPEGRTTVSAELYGYTVLGYNTTAQRVLRQLRKK